MRDKEELFNSLKSIMTKKEFEPVGDKIHKYLTIYAGSFQTFSFVTNHGRVESIKFYTKKLSDSYIELSFDQYGDVTSIRQFANGKLTTEELNKTIDVIHFYRAIIDAANQNC